MSAEHPPHMCSAVFPCSKMTIMAICSPFQPVSIMLLPLSGATVTGVLTCGFYRAAVILHVTANVSIPIANQPQHIMSGVQMHTFSHSRLQCCQTVTRSPQNTQNSIVTRVSHHLCTCFQGRQFLLRGTPVTTPSGAQVSQSPNQPPQPQADGSLHSEPSL